MIRKLWILLALAAVITLLCCGAALADDSGSCGTNVTYSFNSSTGVLTISGTGMMVGYSSAEIVPWYDYRDVISTVSIGSSVTRIGSNAFNGCSGLTSLTIPGGVTSIGYKAFYGCTGLVSVTIMNPDCSIGDTDYDVFKGCASGFTLRGWPGSTAETYAANPKNPCAFEAFRLSGFCGTNVTWAFNPATGTLTISGTGAMEDYFNEPDVPWYVYRESIATVTIGSGVTSIGRLAFHSCSGLTSVTIGSGVTHIGIGAFYGCSGLTSVTIPSSVNSIGYMAFYWCTGLTSVAIPNSVTSIGIYTFAYCTGLNSVTIPSSVNSIGYGAFESSGLTSATVLNPNCAIGDTDYDVFKGCSSGFTLRGWPGSTAETYAANTVNPCAFESLGSLSGSCGTNVTYSFNPATGVLTISGTGAMADYSLNTAVPWYRYKESITTVTIGSGVTSIGTNAFDGCIGLTSVTIPNSVTSIKIAAFFGCTGLTSITIPNSVTSIGVHAFRNCIGLTSVTIPSSVTLIGYEAFRGSGLISAFIMNPDCEIGDSDYDVFFGCDGAFTLFGYSGSTAEAYAANDKHPCGFDLLVPAPDFFLPAGLTSIEQRAFQQISATAAVIPKGVTYIEGNPFAGSTVRTIYGFPGTAAEQLVNTYSDHFLQFVPLTDAWYARLTN